MDEEIKSLMRMETCEIVSRNSVADQNVLPGTWPFKCKRKPDCTSMKFKTQYCVRLYIKKRMSPEPLNSYYPVV